MKTTTFILLLILILTMAFIFAKLEAATMDACEWSEETYIVKRGDTLWDISEKYCPADVDKREWIAKVESINGMTSSMIYHGDVITVLIPK